MKKYLLIAIQFLFVFTSIQAQNTSLGNSSSMPPPISDAMHTFMLNTGTNREILKADFVNPLKGCFLMKKMGCLITQNGGLSFTLSNPANDTITEFSDVATVPGKWVAVSSNGKAYYSTNAGANWSNILDSSATAEFLSVDILNNTIAIGGKNGLLYMLTNDGTGNFTVQNFSIDSLNAADFVQVRFINNELMISSSLGHVLKYNFANNTLAVNHFEPGESISGLRINAVGMGYFITNFGKIFKTIDGGTTWDIKAEFSNYHWNGIDFGDSLVLAVGDSGTIAVSKNSGELFELFSAETDNSLNAARVSSPRGYVVGSGGLGLTLSVTDTTLALKKLEKMVQGNFVFPNPAMGSTLVKNPFKNLDCKIRIFSQSGALVREFNLQANQTTVLELNDLSSGNYYVKAISQDNAVQTRLMVLKQ